MKRILFIVNPIAGTRSKQNIPSIIAEELGGVIDYDIINTQRAGHAPEIIEDNLSKFDVFVE